MKNDFQGILRQKLVGQGLAFLTAGGSGSHLHLISLFCYRYLVLPFKDGQNSTSGKKKDGQNSLECTNQTWHAFS